MPRGCGLGLGLSVTSGYALPNGTEPLILLDFKNGVYMANGDTVAVGDLLVEDENYGTWNPASIQSGVGLVGASAPVFTGDALALILGGSTTLSAIGYNGGVTANSFRYELVDNFLDFGLYYRSITRINSDGLPSYINDDSGAVNESESAVGNHKVVITMIDGKISRSTDGSAIITINPANPWSPSPGAMGFVVPANWVVEQIGIYPPQDDADLPTLSAL
jgi:hypothetical protein